MKITLYIRTIHWLYLSLSSHGRTNILIRQCCPTRGPRFQVARQSDPKVLQFVFKKME